MSHFARAASCWVTASLGGFGWATPAQPEPTFRDAAYGPHERHTLDLWQSAAQSPAPLVIFIHGGGWHGGSKADLPPILRATLLARGVSVAAINYRYTSIAPLPAPAAAAIRNRAFEHQAQMLLRRTDRTPAEKRAHVQALVQKHGFSDCVSGAQNPQPAQP